MRHEVGADEDDDPLAGQLRNLQEQNDISVAALNYFGYKGFHLQAKLKEKKVSARAKLTLPQTKERVESLSAAKTHGERFLVTGGSHLNADDAFKAVEMNLRKAQLTKATAERKKRKRLEKRDIEAREILAKPSLNGTDCGKLLTWHGVDNTNLSAEQKKAKWSKIAAENRPEPTFEKWTDDDEARLGELQSTDLSIEDTELGRKKKALQAESLAAFASKTPEEKTEYLRKLHSMVDYVVEL